VERRLTVTPLTLRRVVQGIEQNPGKSVHDAADKVRRALQDIQGTVDSLGGAAVTFQPNCNFAFEFKKFEGFEMQARELFMGRCSLAAGGGIVMPLRVLRSFDKDEIQRAIVDVHLLASCFRFAKLNAKTSSVGAEERYGGNQRWKLLCVAFNSNRLMAIDIGEDDSEALLQFGFKLHLQCLVQRTEKLFEQNPVVAYNTVESGARYFRDEWSHHMLQRPTLAERYRLIHDATIQEKHKSNHDAIDGKRKRKWV
jgi:hypothetical protein